MTRETRIALLVGLAFIVLFGLVLGQRSLNLQNSSGINVARAIPGTTVVPVTSPTPAPAAPAPVIHAPAMPGPSAEMVSAGIPLAPHAAPTPSNTAAPAAPAPASPAAAAVPTPPTGGAGLSNVAAPVTPSRLSVPAPKSNDTVAMAPTPAPTTPKLIAGSPEPSVSPAVAAATYEVQPGDTLYKIARKVYGQGHENDYAKIYKANQDKVPASYALSVGEKLTIPDAPATAAIATPAIAPAVTPTTPAKPTIKDLVKGKKDATINDLKSVAEKPVSVEPEALAANDKSDKSVLRTSDSPKISSTPKATAVSPKDLVAAKDAKAKALPASADTPAAPGAAVASATAKKYVIKSGDSLAVIARNLLGDSSKATLQKIINANKDRIKDPNQLKVGTELKIPQA